MIPPYVPIVAQWTGGSMDRDARRLGQVIDQFAKELMDPKGRYWPRNGETFCNVLLWDVTRALGCEIPYWWMKRELSANDQFAWMLDTGTDDEQGWASLLCVEDAIHQANCGLPTVAMWKNPVGHGHVAVLRPSENPGMPGPAHVAQAGAVNSIDIPLLAVFGSREVRYFSHP